jgi:molybdopterin/thiamine biosynthesis adenylyltransferase
MTDNEFLTMMLSRQQPIFGEEGCRRLRQSVVAVAGLGGGGALTLELMVRAGVGRFRLLDQDVYEISNLNRQIFATTDSIGRPKVEIAAERIRLINPYAVVEKSFHEKANLKNVEELLDGADIGMLCTDSPSSYILFNQVARRLKVRLICGGTSAMTASAWVEAHDLGNGKRSSWSRTGLRRLARRLTRRDENSNLSEQDALALDVDHYAPDRFTPTVSFGPNFAACLGASLAIKYLTAVDKRPHAIHMNFSDFKSRGPGRIFLASLMQKFRK